MVKEMQDLSFNEYVVVVTNLQIVRVVLERELGWWSIFVEASAVEGTRCRGSPDVPQTNRKSSSFSHFAWNSVW